jgi:holliday junction DNA helicase RuvA
MFHYLLWKIQRYWNKTYIQNQQFWIEINYLWKKSDWEFFIYPHLDDNKKTIVYFAFDSIVQKWLFEDMLKINWIWTKTAFQIVQLPKENLQNAIKTLDVKFFQAIPGIGPKSAKKILLELKWTFDVQDVQTMDIDQKLYKDIVKSLKWFGYDSDKIKSILQTYPEKITKTNMAEVIKRIIGQI